MNLQGGATNPESDADEPSPPAWARRGEGREGEGDRRDGGERKGVMTAWETVGVVVREPVWMCAVLGCATPRHLLALPHIIWSRHLSRPYVDFPVLWNTFGNLWRENEQNDESKISEAELEYHSRLEKGVF
jgi:hypothetical protein